VIKVFLYCIQTCGILVYLHVGYQLNKRRELQLGANSLCSVCNLQRPQPQGLFVCLLPFEHEVANRHSYGITCCYVARECVCRQISPFELGDRLSRCDGTAGAPAPNTKALHTPAGPHLPTLTGRDLPLQGDSL